MVTSASKPAAARGWRQSTTAPVVVVTGPESLLADRAVDLAVAAARARHQPVEVSQLDAAGYEAGDLAVLASPSLFEEHRLIVVRGLGEASDAAITDALDYLRDPQDDVVLVLQHGGGPKARKLLDTAKATAGAVWVDCPAMKRDAELASFVGGEFADARRTISSRGAQALVDAFGSDVRELASACAALISDLDGDIDVEQVPAYHERVEATGFEVADAVVARDRGAALLQLRRALDVGVDPIPLVAAVAMKLRSLAKVASASGRGPQLARDLGMAPWMVDNARRDLRRWNPVDLRDAIVAVAEVDVALKGGVMVGGQSRGRSEDHVYMLEQLVLRVTHPAERRPTGNSSGMLPARR